MAEHGIQDFLFAKRKAAARHGSVDAAALPSNAEVEAALVEYQRLFAGERHEAHIALQRSAALAAMRLLADFQPRLVGPVLSGTATEHADVQLHAFCETPEHVSLRLFDRHVAHEITERRSRPGGEAPGSPRAHPGVHFRWQEQWIDVTVFPLDGLRHAPASPVDGRPMRRADAAEVERLLRSQDGPGATTPGAATIAW
jgi:hypothetical protein